MPAAGPDVARLGRAGAAGRQRLGAFDLGRSYRGSGPGRLVFGYISAKDGSRVEDVVVPVMMGG